VGQAIAFCGLSALPPARLPLVRKDVCLNVRKDIVLNLKIDKKKS